MSRTIVVVVLAITLAFSAASSLIADEFASPLGPYDGPQAGLDAYALGEARRLDAINRQLGWNELFKWQAATQRSSSIYYDPYIPGFDAGIGDGGWIPSALDYRPIWGYGYFETVRQPIGQRQVQTGANRWESFPIYIDEDGPAIAAPVIDAAPSQPAAPAPRGREF